MKANRHTFTAAALLLLAVLFAPQHAYAAESVRLQSAGGVVTLAFEDYLIGALAAEMPASFPTEALKAQAVAIRSYAAASMPRHDHADLCTDSRCCLAWYSEADMRALWGAQYDEYRTRIKQACADTAGEYLLYGDKPALAVFHAASIGQTESGADVWSECPYLVSVESPETAALYPSLVRDVFISYAALADALSLSLPLITAVRQNDAGRVASIEADGLQFTGTQLRTALDLPSTDFSLAPVCGGYIFSVRGRGHGVGMSQYGAAVYASQGLDYREILAHYYPGTEIASA